MSDCGRDEPQHDQVDQMSECGRAERMSQPCVRVVSTRPADNEGGGADQRSECGKAEQQDAKKQMSSQATQDATECGNEESQKLSKNQKRFDN